MFYGINETSSTVWYTAIDINWYQKLALILVLNTLIEVAAPHLLVSSVDERAEWIDIQTLATQCALKCGSVPSIVHSLRTWMFRNVYDCLISVAVQLNLRNLIP